MAENTELKKTIGFTAAFSTVAGTVIGSGVFFKAPAVTAATGSVSLSMLAWLLGGLITICAGLTGAELAAAFPETGGLTRYIEHSYGELWGFLAGWAQSIIYFPANVAALAVLFGTQTVNLLGLSNNWIILIGMIAAISIALLNFVSAKIGGWVQSVTFIVKLIPLAAIILLGFMHDGSTTCSLIPVVAGPHHAFWTSLGNALLATMFAYDGWIHVGNIAGEMKDPKKDLPKAIALGLTIIMIVYLLVNAVFFWVLPINHISGNLNAASLAADHIFGGLGGKIITTGILISVYGTLNGYTMTGMRIPYIMGRQGKLPFSNIFSKLTKSGVPYGAGLVQYVIAVLMMLSGSFDQITNMLIFVIWVFYCMAFIAVMFLRKTQPNLKRPYKVPLFPWIPLIALIGGIFILVNTLFTQFITTIVGVFATLIGIPFYYYLKNKHGFNDNVE